MISECPECGVEIDHDAHMMNGTCHSCAFKVESVIKKSELIAEIERRMKDDYRDDNTWARSGALLAFDDLSDWVKQK